MASPLSRPSARSRTAWLVATALHGAALAALARVPRAAPASTEGRPVATSEEVFELAGLGDLPVVPREAARADEGAPPASARSGAIAPVRAVAPASGAAEATTTIPAAPEAALAPGGGVTVLGPDLDAIGLGTRNPLLAAAASGPPAAAEEGDGARRRATRALVAPLEARDRDLGLLPDGPVRAAVTSAVSVSLAPVRGRAVMRARIDAEGRVTSLEVEDTEGGRSGWIDAAEKALAALRTAKVRMPASAKGASLRLEVTSAWKLPSGQDPGTTVTVAGVPVHRGEGKDSAQLRLLELPKLVTVELAPGVKVQVPMIHTNLLTATTDPSNLGAQARRIVHTRLLDAAWD